MGKRGLEPHFLIDSRIVGAASQNKEDKFVGADCEIH